MSGIGVQSPQPVDCTTERAARRSEAQRGAARGQRGAAKRQGGGSDGQGDSASSPPTPKKVAVGQCICLPQGQVRTQCILDIRRDLTHALGVGFPLLFLPLQVADLVLMLHVPSVCALCARAYMHVFVRACKHVCMHACVCAFVRLCVCAFVCASV